ncbi:FAD-binding oxidoreductase [Roseateles koreensis]|uniref:FAD-binding oxidoreductase n=1 Tax=Roseateles koreensis TaxID=2987526 RepID=A0ABT5KML4_9BURK|nr:FAD-binding oxidoreductase [Roseateles koreensis]MDC8784096.1 FAD-binding oxidoreductase [Roseateles koreensis]
MPVVTTSSGKQFEIRSDETLLEGALRQNIALGYSCRTGRCSSCKGRIRRGATSAIADEQGLTTAEIDAGWILTCVRHADSDIEIEVEDLSQWPLAPALTLPCRIHSLDRLAADVMKVLLRLPPSTKFQYRPGQYIDIIGGNGVRRSYSVANAPSADKLLELHIREVEGGAMSRYWFTEAKVNDLLRLNGPLGTFFLRESASKDLVFLATGTGIAPVKAILEQLAELESPFKPRSATVYWGGRLPADIYFDVAVPDVPLRFVPVLSRANADWTGARGHVQEVFLASQPLLNETLVFACGSDAMINSAKLLLASAGLPDGQFHSDAFVCSATN